MLTMKDCLDLSELTEEEIMAIAEHEHMPEICAAELGNYLVHTSDGVVRIRRMIADDIEDARARGDFKHAALLKLALKHFVSTHSELHPAH